MRKSFILSLVMVVVLIASLATATFAWYTSQTVVNVTSTNVTTANAGESIVIKGTFISDRNETNNSVALTMEEAVGEGRTKIYDPAVLKSGTATAYQAYNFSTIRVMNATLNKAGQYNNDATEFAPAKVVNVNDGAANGTGYIFVGNVGGAAAGTKAYNVTVNIGAGVNNCLRVALFKATVANASAADALGEADFTLLGIFSAGNTNVLYAGALTQDTAPTSTGVVALSASGVDKVYKSGTAIAAGTLGNQLATNDVYRIAVWFEGNKLTNSGVNTTIAFDISFTF